jgi:DNA-binding beta-propeller fold protein YncE
MSAVRAFSVLAALAAAVSVAAPGAAVPGARAMKVCAAAGTYWPTMTLALRGNYAWVACKEQSRLIRVDTRTGKTVRSVRLSGPVIAVTSGFTSIWALDAGGTLYRLNATGRVVMRIAVPAAAPYNVWIGGGSVWVAADQGAEVVRLSPRTNRVVARIPVGDGPADMAFSGATAWVVNHRDRVLTRIDLATNRSTKLATLAGDAPERMEWFRGSLWITGRGTDLLKVDPTTGSLEQTIDIGVSGIDLAVGGDSIWVPTRSAAVDARGFPTMDALKRVSASSGAVSTVVRPAGRVDVHGLAVQSGAVWIADNTRGRLYRIAG